MFHADDRRARPSLGQLPFIRQRRRLTRDLTHLGLCGEVTRVGDLEANLVQAGTERLDLLIADRQCWQQFHQLLQILAMRGRKRVKFLGGGFRSNSG